jgi:hypothetical protein
MSLFRRRPPKVRLDPSCAPAALGLYYKWSKEFLKAGKKHLSGDTER